MTPFSAIVSQSRRRDILDGVSRIAVQYVEALTRNLTTYTGLSVPSRVLVRDSRGIRRDPSVAPTVLENGRCRRQGVCGAGSCTDRRRTTRGGVGGVGTQRHRDVKEAQCFVMDGVHRAETD